MLWLDAEAVLHFGEFRRLVPAIQEMNRLGTDRVERMLLSQQLKDGAQNDWLMQFQADLLGVPVVRPRVAETTALGAAYLAGLGVGYWKDIDEIASQWQQDRRFTPTLKPSERKRFMVGWTRALGRAKRWIE